jgi:hypothetical protein
VLRSFRNNGRTRIDLLVAQDVILRYFLQSTPERRSALLLDEGSQPVTFILWQEVAAVCRAPTPLDQRHHSLVVCADYSRVEIVVNLLLEQLL